MNNRTSWKYINPQKQRKPNEKTGIKRKAVFLDRDGVINIERSYIRTTDDFELYPFAARAIKMINNSDYLAIIITNQSMIAQNIGTFEQLEKIHEKLDHLLLKEDAYVDAIYFCPHHPDPIDSELNTDLRTECNCRKPKHGMFIDAAGDFNIDLKQSVMIGDTERDIIAGKNAGCRTIGVLTGYGLKDSKIKADLIFPDLQQAVIHLLK